LRPKLREAPPCEGGTASLLLQRKSQSLRRATLLASPPTRPSNLSDGRPGNRPHFRIEQRGWRNQAIAPMNRVHDGNRGVTTAIALFAQTQDSNVVVGVHSAHHWREHSIGNNGNEQQTDNVNNEYHQQPERASSPWQRPLHHWILAKRNPPNMGYSCAKA
jgi:hypothetical protein